MPQITLSVRYKKNEELLLTPSELRDMFFYGINIKAKDGSEISEETWKMYIKQATQYIERYLGIKFKKQVVSESISFSRGDFESWGFIRTTYPTVKPCGLDGFIGTIKQITYPPEWLTNRETNDKTTYYRQLYIVPNQGAARTGTLVYNGIVPYLGILGYETVPDYWNARYITGYEVIPQDLLNVVGMLATISPLLILGDLAKANPGTTSQSLSIDGLSQSISGDNNAFKYRIEQYQKQIQEYMKTMSNYYKGVSFAAL